MIPPSERRRLHKTHYRAFTSPRHALATHLHGAGSPLIRAAVAAGVSVQLAATWPASRALERRLKRWQDHAVLPDLRRATRRPRAMIAPASDRLQQLAALSAKHDAQLNALVLRRARAARERRRRVRVRLGAAPRAEHVDLSVPWQPLAWLTTTAMREAWRLNALEGRFNPVEHSTLDMLSVSRGRAAPGADELAALRLGAPTQ
jgi:hypothetical protein